MILSLRSAGKAAVLTEVEDFIDRCGLRVVTKDKQRPWGGFFVIDEKQSEKFSLLFFSGIGIPLRESSGKLSPKILVVQPNKRLSWQYHLRRAEVWCLISGVAGISTSSTDLAGERSELIMGECVHLEQGLRHRLIGLNDWGVVAEIWQHTVLDQPSGEDDIIRLQDDFGR